MSKVNANTNRRAKKSDMIRRSDLCIKTHSVNAASELTKLIVAHLMRILILRMSLSNSHSLSIALSLKRSYFPSDTSSSSINEVDEDALTN